MKGNFYTLGYAGILGSICALLLTAAATMTAPYREANADAEKKRNILDVLQVPYPQNASSLEMVKIFEDNVQQKEYGDIELYEYTPEKNSNTPESIAVEFEGPGLWGPIKGFLALAPDFKTIRGITFYEQEETPGLGGEIVTSAFRDRFKGKEIVDSSGQPGIIIKGRNGNNAVNEVDAISGATMTCDKVQAMLNLTIEKIIKETENNGR
jgi:Na+-transporting NADH:ubiquinone oxidoreductase subunit C